MWLESPSNPLITVADVPAICERVPDDVLVAVDNTFATPLGQRPLDVGADVVVHSATKFLGGHSDLLSGLTVTRDADLADRLAATRGHGGATPGVLETYLATRGVRTLAVRMERAVANAQRVAEWLHDDPRVGAVRYRGCRTHHDVAARTLDSFGAVLSFDLADAAAADAACAACRCHQRHQPGRRRVLHGAARCTPVRATSTGTVRLSVGIEDPGDLIADLDHAFG